MGVIFPEGRSGTVEPLVVTGRSFLSDYLFVHYVDADSVQFGLEHTSRGSVLGKPLRVAPGQPHELRIDLGSLYPPSADPYFRAMPLGEASAAAKCRAGYPGWSAGSGSVSDVLRCAGPNARHRDFGG